MINNYSRYQKGLSLGLLYPQNNGLCACGCGKRLAGRQSKWASQECRDGAYFDFAIIKGDNKIIRQELFKRDEGFCHRCGVYDNKWEADHIIPVTLGGGGNNLSNFQTLCSECHKEKTILQIKSRSTKEQLHDIMQLSFA